LIQSFSTAVYAPAQTGFNVKRMVIWDAGFHRFGFYFLKVSKILFCLAASKIENAV